MFKPVSSRLNIPVEEEAQLRFWKANDIFKKSSDVTDLELFATDS